jgi:N-acetylmuramic acid 6-phosphate etherase
MDAIRNGPELDELPTEGRDPAGADLDLRTTEELVRVMATADASVPAALALARGALIEAIDAIVARLASGGRLLYVGAGTSGRLALVDAVECQSTFGLEAGRVLALVAGGPGGTAVAQEHAEDDAEAGAVELRAVGVAAADAVVGISASGRTPYVVGALETARAVGASTVALVCAEGSPVGALADHEVAVVVGPEVLAGSTRLKAGTAQKLVLNTISTVSMIRLGKTFGNLMVDVVATNDKLRARVRRIVRLATGAPPDEVDAALAASGGETKVAIVMLLAAVDAATARGRLETSGGVVRKALDA